MAFKNLAVKEKEDLDQIKEENSDHGSKSESLKSNESKTESFDEEKGNFTIFD